MKQLDLKNRHGNSIFVDVLYKDDQAPNLIFCCTPMVSVTAFDICYKPLAKYGFNVFAIDFSGVGKSQGKLSLLSVKSIEEDLDMLIDKIKEISQAPIFLFGSTGTGGIIAQNYTDHTSHITAFAQYGICIYGDVSPLGYSKRLLQLFFPCLKLLGRLFPNIKVKFEAPPYNGYHAELDNQFYAGWLQKDPDFFKVNLHFLITLMEIMLSNKKTDIKMPALVFKTTHDRYYSCEYFDKYYRQLTCEKKLVVIDDVHNSYYFYPDLVAKEVAQWFLKFV